MTLPSAHPIPETLQQQSQPRSCSCNRNVAKAVDEMLANMVPCHERRWIQDGRLMASLEPARPRQLQEGDIRDELGLDTV